MLARGDAHVNLRFPKADYREKIWDHCAGQVIVEEASLVISDAEGEVMLFAWLCMQSECMSKAAWAACD